MGVNIFLFLSGYGLAISALSKPISRIKFYQKRLVKLYIPLWLTLILFLVLDYLILGRLYSIPYITNSFLGFFDSAKLFIDINSPLWYFTFIIFYYVLFPIVFIKKLPWVSAGILYTLGYFIVYYEPVQLTEVLHLYNVHLIAFPLGVFVAGITYHHKVTIEQFLIRVITHLKAHSAQRKALRVGFLTVVGVIAGYTAYHSNVGGEPYVEEITSLVTGSSLIALALFSKWQSKFLIWVGVYSYEIYLLHWPMLSRFDVFYSRLPASLATLCALLLVYILSVGLNWLHKKLHLNQD